MWEKNKKLFCSDEIRRYRAWSLKIHLPNRSQQLLHWSSSSTTRLGIGLEASMDPMTSVPACCRPGPAKGLKVGEVVSQARPGWKWELSKLRCMVEVQISLTRSGPKLSPNWQNKEKLVLKYSKQTKNIPPSPLHARSQISISFHVMKGKYIFGNLQLFGPQTLHPVKPNSITRQPP